MKRISRLLRYLAEYKGKVGLYFLFNLLSIVFGLLSFTMLIPVLNVLFGLNGGNQVAAVAQKKPLSINFVEDLITAFKTFIQQQDKMTALAYVCLTVIFFTILKNLFLYLALYILNPLRNAVLRRLRDELFTKTLSLPIGFFTEERKGDLISRMTNDINEVELSIMGVLEAFIREPLTILFYLGAMVYINYQLTLVLLVLLPVAGLIIGRISKSLRKSSNLAQEQLGSMLGVIDETLVGMRVLKAFNAENHQHLRFMKLNNLLFRTRNRIAARRELASPLSETMGIVVVSIILWYGGKQVFSGALEAATFLGYIGLFTMIINPFKSLSNAFYNVQKGSSALDRIESLLAVENTITELPNAKPVKAFEESITFKNVTFAYGDKVILDDVSFTVPKGKMVAVVGASGAGKSTLADLIPRFHDVTGGEILLDGTNIKHYKIDELRRLMGVVSQDPILFNDTIYSNITLGTGGATPERVEEAARIANAAKFIQQKEQGYETVAGDRGARLSGGERQRITIARAVLKNPPILILDEATSSLDTESERIVQEAINKLMENRTCIVIAHRLSTVQHADEIIVMERGKIVERGTHAALLLRDGIYKRLVEMQQVR